MEKGGDPSGLAPCTTPPNVVCTVEQGIRRRGGNLGKKEGFFDDSLGALQKRGFAEGKQTEGQDTRRQAQTRR